jgi:hypothetical protein
MIGALLRGVFEPPMARQPERRTESSANGRTFWNVRATPSALMRSEGNPVMSAPRSAMRPDSGLIMPKMVLNVVVLPAPLGPTSPRISPFATSKSTLSTARSPPK